MSTPHRDFSSRREAMALLTKKVSEVKKSCVNNLTQVSTCPPSQFQSLDFMKLKIKNLRSSSTLSNTAEMTILATFMNSKRWFNMTAFYPIKIYTFVKGFWSLGSSMAPCT